jgi:hypothetical protein
MVLSFLYPRIGALLGALVRTRRSFDSKDIELLVLRHELEVLCRQAARPKLRPADGALLAAATFQLPHPVAPRAAGRSTDAAVLALGACASEMAATARVAAEAVALG